MIIKVCGMRDSRNIQEVSALAVNWIGLIFYERSPRFIGQSPTKQWTVDSGQLTVKYRLSQLSTVNCQLSTKKSGRFRQRYHRVHDGDSLRLQARLSPTSR